MYNLEKSYFYYKIFFYLFYHIKLTKSGSFAFHEIFEIHLGKL